MYRLLFRVVLTRLDPEFAHSLAFQFIRIIALTRIGVIVHRFTRPHPSLGVDALGLRFPSPFGVAAGFDKEAKVVQGLWQLGFGHVEVGTLTAQAQTGNARPRMFRLIADRAVVNRMGFNNHGSADALPRLQRERRRASRPIIGVNIGKSRLVDVDDAIADYLASTSILAGEADYLVVNVSSPNTPGLRGLQELDKLGPLLAKVRDAAAGTPVLVKIAPDLTDDEVREIATLVTELSLDGIIATNTTLSRAGLQTDASVVEGIGAGGLSGAPLAARSLAMLKLIRGIVPAELCVISVGGVETAGDVAERLAAGATLVQGYTGFIFRGPLWAAQINRGLARLRSEKLRPGTGRA